MDGSRGISHEFNTPSLYRLSGVEGFSGTPGPPTVTLSHQKSKYCSRLILMTARHDETHDLILFVLVLCRSLETSTENRKNLQHLPAHKSYASKKKCMFKTFYLHFSKILMCLQPCGSDMIRQSGAGSNAMI